MNIKKIKFIRPKVVVSKCLEFAACRYDGQLINNTHIKKLKKFIDFIPICPEVEIGMGTPRDTIRIIENSEERLLYQPETGKDFSKEMDSFSKIFLGKIKDVDGFILKTDSPSCGVYSAKIYPNKKNSPAIKKSSGFFATQVLNSFPNYPIEEEKRLNNIFIRENFYTSIFTTSDFKNVKDFNSLYKFHAKHKYLFMSYNQIMMTKMGNIAANKKNEKFNIIKEQYFKKLLQLLSKNPRISNNINTQMHVMGYFKKFLTKKEKQHFLNIIELYKDKKIPSSTVNSILNSWVNRFGNEYLEKQSYFLPFPNELIESEKSRFV
tara:strand:+ start:8701 stop:9663 length:963 start_codon:yes stop_codon:yes gene_type:complete